MIFDRLNWLKRPFTPRAAGRPAWTRCRLELEPLETRLVPAFNLSISTAATVNVLHDTTGQFTATASGANINVADVRADLLAGKDVTIRNGSAGAETGTITWQAGSNLDYNTIGPGGPGGRQLNVIADPSTQPSGQILLNANIADANLPTSVNSSFNLEALRNRVGETFSFQVTGTTSGSVWGTDIYTSDSALATAAVHAGVLQPGASGVVTVTMVQPPTVFLGSARNGVTSNNRTTGWPGAYRVEQSTARTIDKDALTVNVVARHGLVVNGSIVAGAGTILLQADAAASGNGTLAIASGATVNSANGGANGVTLRGADVNIQPGSNVTAVGMNVSTYAASALSAPHGAVFDAQGNLFVANGNRGVVSKVTPQGAVSTFAAGFVTPHGLAFDAQGNLFVTDLDGGTVSKVTPQGVVSTFVAGLNNPRALAFDAQGNLYVADRGTGLGAGMVRKVTPQGVVSTFVAGASNPQSLVFDAQGNLYYLDSGALRKVTPQGAATTFVDFFLNNVVGQLTIDAQGNIYGTDNNSVRKVTPQGVVSTFLFFGLSNSPEGLAFDTQGNLFVADDNRVRKVTPQGDVSTFVDAALSSPQGLAFDAQGNLFVADFNAGTVNKVTPQGAVTTFVPAVLSQIGTVESAPVSLAFDAQGNLFVGDWNLGTVRKVTPQGAVSIVGTGFTFPQGLAFDAQGNLYVGQRNSVSKVTPQGVQSTFADGFNFAYGLAFDAQGNLFVAEVTSQRVRKVTPDGTATTFADGFNHPRGLAIDAQGNLYVANGDDGTVRKVTPQGAVSTFASGFKSPAGLVIDAQGNLYVADSSTGAVSKIAMPGTVTVRSSIPSRPMSLGGADNAVTGINLTDAELAQITTGRTGAIVFGDSSQTGDITFRTATPTSAVTPVVVQQNPALGGKIVLDDDAAGTPGVALNAKTANVSLTAGTGGIVAAGGTNAFPEIGNPGTVTLTTAGPIGSPTHRIQLDSLAALARVATGSADPVYLGVAGALVPSSIAVGSSAARTIVDQPATFTAEVTNPFRITPTGTVTFKAGNTTLGTVPLTATPGRGTASFTPPVNPPALGIGSHTITAVYNGDGAFQPSTTPGMTQTVTGHPPMAVHDEYTVPINDVLEVDLPGVLANDIDAENDALTAVLVSGPVGGTLDLRPNGSFRFTPAPNAPGPFSFTYLARDPRDGDSSPVTVTITGTRGVPGRNSLADAPRTLYLDFDGHTEAKWGPYRNVHTPAFDLDGDSTSFSAAEQDALVEIWARVAEDFAPFNVNVTTVVPASFADGAAVRVAIGGTSDWLQTTVAGHAWLGSFSAGDPDPENPHPNTVFAFLADRTTGLPYSSAAIADTASHEAGHAFGLRHQSQFDPTTGLLVQKYRTGDAESGPLMGNAAGSRRSVWAFGPSSDGDETNRAPVPAGLQDDLALLAVPLGYRADDHADTPAGATPLTQAGNGLSGAGVIGQTSDVDYFRFTTNGGQIILRLDVAAAGPNFRGRLELYGADGGLIAAADSGQNLFVPVSAAGTYFVAVRSHGGHGDVGQYTVSGTVTPTNFGVSITPANLRVQAGGSAQPLSVVLTAPPLTNVVVTLAANRPLLLSAAGETTVTFTPSNWNVPQTVLVTAVDNHVAGEQIVQIQVNVSAQGSGTHSAPLPHLSVVVTPPLPDFTEAVDDAYAVVGNQTLTGPDPGVLANDRDSAGRALTAQLRTGPAHGAATVFPAGGFTYTPRPGFVGTDTFTYVAFADGVASNVATVTINVLPPPADRPVAVADTYTVVGNQTLTGPDPGVLANDRDSAGRALTAQLRAGPAHGAATVFPAGGFTYTPRPGFVGTDTFTYVAFAGGVESNVATVTVNVLPAPPPPPLASSAGVFDPGTGTFYLRNAGASFRYGAPGWIALAGDWDGDGTTTIGVVDPTTMTWYLRNTNAPGAPDVAPFRYGAVGWVPVVGDWDGDGKDTPGVFDPATATWYFAVPGRVLVFAYGAPGWAPVVGDWDGDRTTTVGVYNPSAAVWHLAVPGGVVTFAYGGPNWQPITGDWNGDRKTSIGVFDPAGNWYLRNTNTAGPPDVAAFAYGAGGWVPLAGRWKGAAGARLLADRAAPAGGVDPGSLAAADLAGITAAAATRLQARGADGAALAGITFQIAPLPGRVLGVTSGTTVVIDADGAGHGWFVDATPLDDADAPAAAGRRMDLLTVVMHELGHVLGLDDLGGLAHPDDLMADTLPAGVRRTAILDRAFARGWL